MLRVQRDWTSLLNDPDFMVQYETILADFDEYMANGREHWFAREHGDEVDGPVAYFCAEYGLQESLPIYSGGLGVLADDLAAGVVAAAVVCLLGWSGVFAALS